MNKKERIEREIDKTLEMFDKKDTLKPNPYFYTRVKQRIEEKSKPNFSIAGILKPAFFTLLFVVNLTTVVWYTSNDSINTDNQTNYSLTNILKSDFNLESSSSEILLFEEW